MPPSVSDARVLLACVAFRVVNALCSGATVFNPDEQWQSLEVAYDTVWGNGFLPWEYQQHAQLRGALHPMIFAALYSVLKWTHLDSRWAVMHAPRLLQALFAGVGEFCLFRLARPLLGEMGARLTLFFSLTSWFQFYCLTRTLSNSMETSLCLAAFSFWPDTTARPFPSKPSALVSYERSRRIALIIAAVAFVIRPTNVLIWLLLGAYHLAFVLPSHSARVRVLLVDVIPIALLTLLASALLDSAFYASLANQPFSLLPCNWTLVSWNFLRLNFGSDLAALYGSHAWHWYFTEGLPVNLGIALPFFVFGAVQFVRGGDDKAWRHAVERQADNGSVGTVEARKSLARLLGVLVWCLLTYSMSVHKEYRFILVVTPIAFLFAAKTLLPFAGTPREEQPALDSEAAAIEQPPATEVVRAESEQADSSPPEVRHRLLRVTSSSKSLFLLDESAPSGPPSPRSSTSSAPPSSPRVIGAAFFVVIVVNVVMAFYFSAIHQSGPANVAEILHKMRLEQQSACKEASPSACEPLRVHFLLQCHTIPLFSYLHQPQHAHDKFAPIDAQFLDCSPLFINGALHGNGANPCSASALFESQTHQFIRDFYHPIESSVRGQTKQTRSAWPWYDSEQAHRCYEKKLKLSDAQMSAINNELPGGAVQQRPLTAGRRVAAAAVMPHVIVITKEKYSMEQGYLASLGYSVHAEVFHSQLDDIKAFVVLKLKPQA